MVRQPPETQTLFAELSERLRVFEAARSFANLAGAFTKKPVRGADYWYFKSSAGPAGQREYFVGPDNRETQAVMKACIAGRRDAEAAAASIERLCAMLRQGGALLTDTPSARVVAGLASAGMFKLGAVLVGTHAFSVLGNVLGVRWESGLRTQDIDLAASRILHVAVPQTELDLPRTLDALNMGFLPVPGLNPKAPETSFKVRGHTLRVDLLTPARGARDAKPISIPRFKAAAQPLELLDYLLEVAVAAPLVNGGATLVNVPDPARFALHKLIVSGRRQVFEQSKAGKDRQQAAEIIAALYEDRRGDINLAVKALNQRPAAWRSRLKRELAKLPADMEAARTHIRRSLQD
ncbi:MAG: hypothetical protein K8S22_09660 [Betaproteobacteria bacterium]|nr:hypothetical protein [Betaproteobacteria bacterium]